MQLENAIRSHFFLQYTHMLDSLSSDKTSTQNSEMICLEFYLVHHLQWCAGIYNPNSSVYSI